MNASPPIQRKRYIDFPAPKPRPAPLRRALRHLIGLVALPFALAMAAARGTPGLGVRLWCIRIGLRTLASGRRRRAFLLVVDPMDSFRYFELDFVRTALEGLEGARYLDVSSPRLVPLMALDRRAAPAADLVNPIAEDLRETLSLFEAVRLSDRVRGRQVLIDDLDVPDGSFDLITSISVVEHIPDDVSAIRTMWRLLAPGGRLVVSVPCAPQACEEYANLDEYALLSKDARGFVYWQRYYDRPSLEQRIWATTGAPVAMRIYGEARAGSYDRNVLDKRTDPEYPYWWEPSMMGEHYRHFETIEQLPGMGVVAMVFVKPPEPAHA